MPFPMTSAWLPVVANRHARGVSGSMREGRFLMRVNGTVKFFNQSKGYGFISPDEGGKDVFVHVSDVERSGLPALDEGMRLTFETEPDKRGKGPKAINLQISE